MRYTWIVLGLALNGYAASLSSITAEALKTNSEYLSALAGAAAVHDTLAIAKDAWLPQIDLTITKGLTEFIDQSPPDLKGFSYGLNLNQKIFDMSSWLLVQKQAQLVQQAVYNAVATRQSVIYQVSVRYFKLLESIAAYENEQAKLKSYKEQLRKVEQEFKAGKAANPELSQVKSQYLLSKAETLSAKNTAMHNVQRLAELTGSSYKFIKGLGSGLALKAPKPNKVKHWLLLTKQNNLSLKAARASMLASEQDIAAMRAAGVPVLAFSSSFSRVRPVFMNDASSTVRQWGLSLNWPLFHGGANRDRYVRSEHTGVQARQALIAMQRNLKQQATNTFNDVNLGLERVWAGQQAVVAAEVARRALAEGYSAGTQTITDVLESIAKLHAARLQLIKARYAYIDAVLHMKLLIGSLSMRDIQAIEPMFVQRKNLTSLS